MRITSRRLTSLGAVACLAIAGGCGDDWRAAVAATAEAAVTGKVTVKGKPATKGQVVFDPRNINRRDARVETAEIGADGTYKATTLVGRNSVTVIVPKGGGTPAGMNAELGLDVKPEGSTLDVAMPYSPQ